MTFRLIIAGGRDFANYPLLKMRAERYISSRNLENVTIVSGGADGADSLGERFAEENGYRIDRFVPNWSVGRQAGAIRNKEMADASDGLLAFYNGSNGTGNMILTARRNRLDVEVVKYEKFRYTE